MSETSHDIVRCFKCRNRLLYSWYTDPFVCVISFCKQHFRNFNSQCQQSVRRTLKKAHYANFAFGFPGNVFNYLEFTQLFCECLENPSIFSISKCWMIFGPQVTVRGQPKVDHNTMFNTRFRVQLGKFILKLLLFSLR